MATPSTSADSASSTSAPAVDPYEAALAAVPKELILGSPVIGCMVNCLLFGIELTMLAQYLKRYPTDKLYYKILVSLVLLVDIVGTVDACAYVYTYCVKNWGSLAYIGTQNWTLPIVTITMAFSGLFVQTFLIYRFYGLSKAKWIAGILGLLSLAAFGASMSTAGILIKFNSYIYRDKLLNAAILWLSVTAASDIIISLSLIITLLRMRTSFKSTNSLINRLIINAIQTGASGSAIALLVLITFLQNDQSNNDLGFGLILGRVYAITLFHNLNSRNSSVVCDSQCRGNTVDYQSVMESGIARGHGTAGTANSRVDKSGIHVGVHQVVHMDHLGQKNANQGSDGQSNRSEEETKNSFVAL